MSHSTPILARHLFVVLMSAAVTTSCSHLFAHAYTLRGCEWLEIDEPDAQVTAQRVTIGEEAACTAAKASYECHQGAHDPEPVCFLDEIDGYNSNGFITGLLATLPLPNPGWSNLRYPGWNRPILPIKFGLPQP